MSEKGVLREICGGLNINFRNINIRERRRERDSRENSKQKEYIVS